MIPQEVVVKNVLDRCIARIEYDVETKLFTDLFKDFDANESPSIDFYCRTLRLVLRSKNISFNDECVIKVAQLLSNTRKIKKLVVRSGYSEYDSIVGRHIQRNNLSNIALQTIFSNTNLNSISLNGKLGIGAIQLISDILKVNRTLTSFGLNNSLGSNDGKIIAEILSTNQVLTDFDISDNKELGNEGMKLIIESLKFNCTLTSIDLSNNKIGTDGAKSIAEVIKFNQILKKIDLRTNMICHHVCSAGFDAMAEALKMNYTLERIDVHENDEREFYGGGGYRYDGVDFLGNSGYPFHPFKEVDDATFIIHDCTYRNRIISDIRRKIPTLFSDATFDKLHTFQPAGFDKPYETFDESYEPLEESHFSENKENIESRILKIYQEIIVDCKKLRKDKCDDALVKNFEDQALIGLCSWDTFENLETRIKILTEIVQTNGQNLILQQKALSCLTHNYFAQAMMSGTDNREMTQTILLSTYVCGLHGTQDEITLGYIALALCQWRGIDSLLLNKRTHLLLAEELLTENPEQFQILKANYIELCNKLGLKPLAHLQEIEKSNKASLDSNIEFENLINSLTAGSSVENIPPLLMSRSAAKLQGLAVATEVSEGMLVAIELKPIVDIDLTSCSR